ncbi:MerR family copper efflux transcriptional regulator [Povalibacter uvarum]|uniref:MerR family copper efflux transcriptional regulator n=1 Tax=Povalibacter uvarum TaxID=732238 RepID=A0A841HRM3_9GAMM|nr:MerR family transcriptional regulator [Povalibacter uvarum]MBB6094959.1 MerR family copper efflux transcriptional regulator [Povalibacter uvarum]
MHGLSIGRLAKLANVSTDTIRFYEKAGLLAPPVRRPSGFREYSLIDLKRLKFIRCGRFLGFSLEEIGELLMLKGGLPAGSVVRQRLQVIDRMIEELTRWRRSLIDFLEIPATGEPGGHSILDCFTDESTDAAAVAFLTRSSQESQRDCHGQL